MFGDEHEPVQRVDAGLLHADRDLRPMYLQCAVWRVDAGVQHDDARVSGVRQRRRVWRIDTGVPAGGLVWTVLGDERHPVHGRDARVRRGHGDVRAVYL
jgi:hypothetical protein